MKKKVLSILLIAVFLTVAALPLLAPPSGANAQIIITFLPTSTRTPTPVNIGNFVWDDLDQDGFDDVFIGSWENDAFVLLGWDPGE